MARQISGQPVGSNPTSRIIEIGTVNAVVYTVPVGRKFIGQIYNRVSGSNGPRIDSKDVGNFSQIGEALNPSAIALLARTLIAGTVVSNASSNQGTTVIFGIEEDE